MGLQRHLVGFKMLCLINQENLLPTEHRNYLLLCILMTYKVSDCSLLLCSGFIVISIFLYSVPGHAKRVPSLNQHPHFSGRQCQLRAAWQFLSATDFSHILLCTRLTTPSFPFYKDTALFNRSLVDCVF
jgi:hypothetical protein